MHTVSVIVPVFNRENIISKTLENLKKQNYRPLEVILVDDASTDDTIEKIYSFINNNFDNKFNIRLYLNKKNKGACYCRNFGIGKSTGKYLQFLDSDDQLHSNKIRDQVNLLEYKNSNLVLSDYEYRKDNEILKKCLNNGNLFKKVSLGWSIYTSSPLIKFNLIKDKLYWNEKLIFLQDKDFLFKLLMLSGNYIYLPGFTSYYMQHSDNQISDLYLFKKPQFFILILSRASFLFKNLFKLKFKCILYTCLGIVQIIFESIFYYMKKIIKILFREKIYSKIKNIYQFILRA